MNESNLFHSEMTKRIAFLHASIEATHSRAEAMDTSSQSVDAYGDAYGLRSDFAKTLPPSPRLRRTRWRTGKKIVHRKRRRTRRPERGQIG